MSVQIPLHKQVQPVSEAVLARQHRTALIAGIGPDGIARLSAASVLVVGAGGLGSPALLYLAAAGVGRLGISDTDLVEESNLQRQVVHDQASLGRPKTESAAARVRGLNPGVEVVELPAMTLELLDQIGAEYDLVLDCTDNFAAKYLLADWCSDKGIPLVWGTIVAASYQLSVFWSAPPPGLPATRLRDVYPTVPQPGQTPTSLQIGVLGSVVGQAGSSMATEAIKLITGFGEPLLGRLLIADAAQARYHVLDYTGGQR